MPDDASPPRPRSSRSDGEQSRLRLLQAGLALFAQHGYAQTSTRDIAEAAGTNLAAIGYYFGDKAGLYRAAFRQTMGEPAADIARYSDPALTLPDALRGFYAGFIDPMREGDSTRQCMKLHMREMLEPTGMWEQEIAQGIRPGHEALLALLRRHLGVKRNDDDLQRLATALAALGVYLHIGRDVTDALAPTLNADSRAFDAWLDRLALYGEAMVEAERQRRASTKKNTRRTPSP